MYIQGSIGNPTGVVVAVNGYIYHCTTIYQGLDFMYKAFWVFELVYPAVAINFFELLEGLIGMTRRGSLVPTLGELLAKFSK